MKRNRLEAFSDGVIAIIITIMVLELKAPDGNSFSDIMPLLPIFLSYLLSFVYVGIYWNNHHHLVHTIDKVNGSILWANLHLLFWLSLLPFSTAWMGAFFFETEPVVLYNFILLMAAIAYYILSQAIIRHNKQESKLLKAIGEDKKGKLSLVIYLLAIPSAYFNTYISLGLSVVVAVIWLVPDKRIENVMNQLGE